MLCTLAHTSEITLDLEVARVTWSASVARQFGAAEVRVPRRSDAFSPLYINEDGGSLITIEDGDLGTWPGVVEDCEVDEWGARLTCTHLAAVTSHRRVGHGRLFKAMTAAVIIRAALLDAVVGLSRDVLRIGALVEAAPVVPEYQFRGQTLAEVLGDMQAATGGEWEITADRALNWQGQIGSFYSLQLCADGDIEGASRKGSVAERVAEVTAIGSNGTTYTARAPEVYGADWSRQEIVNVSSTSQVAIAAAAEAELARRRGPNATFVIRLRREPLGFYDVDEYDSALYGDAEYE